MKYRFLIFLMLISVLTASAKPARPGLLRLRQPDGSYVPAYLKGDEYGSITVSADGYALIMDDDGFYSYALYDGEGRKHSTFCHYGAPVSPEILAGSARIPYDIIFARASELRVSRGLDYGRRISTKAGASDKVSAVIILAQFSDMEFKYSERSFEELLAKAKKYFEDQFVGKTSFEFVLTPMVTLSKPYSYYGKNSGTTKDPNAPEAVAEACTLVNDYVDFSRFDNDGDGCVDNVLMFYAGPDEAEKDGNYIWSHCWDIESAGIKLTLDGVRIKKYAATSELGYNGAGDFVINNIGSFCHEFGHLLGLRDLYDSDGVKSGGETSGVYGYTSLMDIGNYNDDGRTPPNFNAIEREMLGIGIGMPLYEGLCRLTPVNEDNQFFRLDTGVKDDYYLFEFRKASGWDKYIGGSGLLVYHVNKSESDAGYSEAYQRNLTAKERWTYNAVNCNPDYMCARVVEAAKPFSSTDISSIFYPGVNAKYTTCIPYEGSFYSLANISRADNELSFMVLGSLYMDEPDIYQDAVILNWHLGMSWTDSPEAMVLITQGERKVREAIVQPVSNNKYSCTIEGLEPGTEYGLLVEMSLPDGIKARCTANFSTGKIYDGVYPAITFGKADRHISGAFKNGAKIPLRIKNEIKSQSEIWKFNDKVISVDPGTGYYELVESGILTVEYVTKDGTRETIIKEISVK